MVGCGKAERGKLGGGRGLAILMVRVIRWYSIRQSNDSTLFCEKEVLRGVVYM